MARAGLVQVTDAVFEKNGKQIPYRKVSLTGAAYSVNETTPIEFIMKETAVPAKRKGKRKGGVAAKRKRAKRPETPGWSKPVAEDQRSKVGSDSGIEEALRAWRLAEARRRGVPAFRILSDQALRAMATRRPGTVRELLAIPGIGITTVEKYARQFYRILQKSGG
jgi:superfamily II DNA helicase RecQ